MAIKRWKQSEPINRFVGKDKIYAQGNIIQLKEKNLVIIFNNMDGPEGALCYVK